MIPRECKRLAEVDFPISVVSKHAAREKSIRHGHPSTLHLWWARRPLASSRAVLLALLLPDPCDAHCPEAFRTAARRILLGMPGRPHGWADTMDTDLGLRRVVLAFIGRFADWNNAADAAHLNAGRALVQAAHGDEAPLVVDPFAGGGSIPLEALRLGCEAFASDLNPVACLILKVMLEDVPRHGPGLADELRRVGGEVKAAAEKALADLYPPDPDGATPIAYLWARTVRCEAPNCGAEIPLMRSFWLCKKARRKRALRPHVVRSGGEPPRVAFEIVEPGADREVGAGTVARAKAACPCCHVVLPPERVRAQLAAQRGGADVVFDDAGRRIGGARLTAVVTLRPGEKGRHYRPAAEADYAAVRAAQARLAGMLDAWERGGKQGLCPVPDEPISLNEIRRISLPIYGMTTWGDLFTARQKVALVALARLIAGGHRDDEVASAANPLLGIAVNKTADLGNALARWKPDAECPVQLLARQAIGMVWDFCESVPPCNSSGSFLSAYRRSADALDSIGGIGPLPGQIQSADAAACPLPGEAADVWFTDPPYYDAVPYAHLSDFFFVWLKRVLPDRMMNSGSLVNMHDLTPKEKEIVVDRPHRLSTSTKTAETYESGMAEAFAEGRRVLHPDAIGSVVFAHKTTEGWEALLSGMINGGWTITGSWPVATEMGSRLNARDTASLATSIHLICRPRPGDAPVGDWTDVLRALPPRVGEWMERLQGEGVRGADLVFACIGPALEIFSRHPRVETADGRGVGLAAYLEKVWEVVGRTALENILGAAEAQARNGLAGALEEDARLTALFLWTLQATGAGEIRDAGDGGDTPAAGANGDEAPGDKAGGFSLVFDVVRRFAQPLGIDLPKWEKRTIETKKGVVRLLPVAERAQQLFGEGGSQAVAAWIEHAAAGAGPLQGALFPDRRETAAAGVRERPPGYGAAGGPGDDRAAAASGDTTLDRVHRGMLLQAGGQTNALHALLKAELQRGPDFLRLSNALSALYPRGSEEKRLLDAMLLAVPR